LSLSSTIRRMTIGSHTILTSHCTVRMRLPSSCSICQQITTAADHPVCSPSFLEHLPDIAFPAIWRTYMHASQEYITLAGNVASAKRAATSGASFASVARTVTFTCTNFAETTSLAVGGSTSTRISKAMSRSVICKRIRSCNQGGDAERSRAILQRRCMRWGGGRSTLDACGGGGGRTLEASSGAMICLRVDWICQQSRHWNLLTQRVPIYGSASRLRVHAAATSRMQC
jgi:hypothetical protein